MRVLPESRVAIVRLSDSVDGYELLRVVEALYRSPGLKPGFSFLWDACRLRVLDLLPSHVELIQNALEQVDPRLGVGRTVVLGRDDHDEVTVRLLTVKHRRSWGRRVFVCARPEEAAMWLGIPAEVLGVERPRPVPVLPPQDEAPIELAPFHPSLATGTGGH